MGRKNGTGDSTWSAMERVVSDVRATRQQIARLQAEEARLLADAVGIVTARENQRRAKGRRAVHELALREASSELATAMRLSDRTVQARMSSASMLVERFAETHRALVDGRIDHAHAVAIVDQGTGLADDVRAEYERILVEAAGFETPSRLRAIARVVAARIDPELAAELQRRAAGERRLRVVDLGDGMARLLADLPAILAHAIFDRLSQMAEAERTAERGSVDAAGPTSLDAEVAASAATTGDGGSGETPELSTGPSGDQRSLDELRADLLADLVLTGIPAAHGEGDALASIRAEVQIAIPVLTAAGVDVEPALLTGYGPVDAEMARRLAADAPGWDRVMYHPHSGLPLAVDRYRPSAELRRFLRARDERCRFPGCMRKPTRCDVDHTHDHARGGGTRDGNLAHFCRRHHTLKHASPWRVRQCGGGELEWISPTGRSYLDKPPSTVQFVPSAVFARYLQTAYTGGAPF